ncbi:CPBP family intramembrane glutamic endopeptidase [Methanococcoides burtonii]|uniref:CAAX-amino-terminal protease family protein n=1 Tax=Methanococcoides burtonii (strain DSM 6242 / NBRC 107633 / OCM 468 / ACE-M) TaxID=259564 RepID=Q12UI9_METBU|nr:CPBP family intramembrane glutamic endopeptidase [Methanococcoides burtonii]ABE52887.1 CAAX-amino-terminal protease family protein [Methanococcoides burtonii DSM 6242]
MDPDIGSEDVALQNGRVKYFLNMEHLTIIIPSLTIILAELSLFFGYTKLSTWVHIILLVVLTLSTIVINDADTQYLFRAFILLSLLRILNLSMPVFFDLTLYSYVFIYAPLLIPIYVLVKDQGLDMKSLGMVRSIRYYELPLALLVGLIIALGEFMIIKPGYLIPDLSFFNLLKISIVMIIFVGFFEEIIFRSILQTKLESMIGKYQGLFLASILFGVMHSGYGTLYEMLFTAFAGLVLGYMYQRSRSLFLVSITHGFVNVFLFGVLPHLA